MQVKKRGVVTAVACVQINMFCNPYCHVGCIAEGSSVDVWEDVWHEATAGPESGIRQNMSEICCLLKHALESPSWTMKAQVNKIIFFFIIFIILKKCWQNVNIVEDVCLVF